MRPIQYFSDEYLEHCKKLSATEIAEFLEGVRILSEAERIPDKSILISIKIPKPLLSTFRTRCAAEGIPYQTKIKELMKKWALEGNKSSNQS